MDTTDDTRCHLSFKTCDHIVIVTFREGGEDGDSQGDGSSQPDTISIASRTSQNTVDSDKVEDAQIRDELMAPSCPTPTGFPTRLLWVRAGAV